MTVSIQLEVNGKAVQAEVEPRRLLVHFLREDLGLTGANIGCETSLCGACTILIDGQAVKSCTVLAAQADGCSIMTIEGLGRAGDLHPLQEAFWAKHGLQCGFCTPGMIMASTELLKNNPSPSEEEIRAGIEGNYCRCTGYQNIVRAIAEASSAIGG